MAGKIKLSPPASNTARFKPSAFWARLYIASDDTFDTQPVRQLLERGPASSEVTYGNLTIEPLSADVPRHIRVTSDATSINVMCMSVRSVWPCGPRSNLNLMHHVCQTYLFSFYKYGALILPPLSHVVFIKDPKVRSDGWQTSACGPCAAYFWREYRTLVSCAIPNRTHECECTVCIRQPPKLKGMASEVTLRYVLGGRFQLDAKITYRLFRLLVTCSSTSHRCLLPQDYLPRFITKCYFEDIGGARFHVGCRHRQDSLRLCWMTQVAKDRDAFIELLLDGRSKYWCAKCDTLLLDVWNYPSVRCAGKRMRVSFVD
jgi:hypothetical protein